jgi:hypothetical protein
MAQKHRVTFKAKKKVSVPAKISFKTKTGPVKFAGHKTVKKTKRVSFMAKGK